MNTIYLLNIRELLPQRDAALALLSDERRARVLAMNNEEEALRSMGAGLLLRRYVGDGPFARGEFGKPYLPGGPPFSLSHGGDLAVLAVGEEGTELGVDVESLARPWREAVARRLFTTEEQTWLQNSGERFFRLWTRKEAVLKCRGSGLSRLTVFPVLHDQCTLDGIPYRLNTLLSHGHCLSLAVRGDSAEAEICMINVQILFEYFG